MLASWASLHYNIYKYFVKLACFKIGDLNADEYFLCIGYFKCNILP